MSSSTMYMSQQATHGKVESDNPAPTKRQRSGNKGEGKARPVVGSMQWVASEQWANPGQIHKLLRKYKNAKTSTRKSKPQSEKKDRTQSPSSSVSGKSNETSNSPMEQHQSRALSVASTATPDSNSHSDDTSWSPYAITNRFDAGRISTSSMSPNNVPTYHRPIHYDGDYASSASASFTPLSAALPFIVAGDDLKSHVQNTHTGNNNSFFQQTRMPSFSCNDLSPGLFNSSKNASDCVLNSTMGTSFNLPQNRYSHSSSKPFAALPPSVLNQLLYELQQQQQLQQQILLQKSALQDATKQRAFSEQIRALGNTSGLNLEGLHGGLGINSLRNLPVTVQQELLLLQSSFIH